MHKKAQKVQKAQNAKQVTFFFLDVFYAHINAAFFVFVHLDSFKFFGYFHEKVLHAQKAQKAQKVQKRK